MKTRNGFVSNSSSSSFVLITNEENHNQVLDHIRKTEGGEILAKIADSIVGRKKIGETSIVVFASGGGEAWEGLDLGPIESFSNFDNKKLYIDIINEIQESSEDVENADDAHELIWEAQSIYTTVFRKYKLPCITQTLSL